MIDMHYMKDITIKNIKVASRNGKYFRVSATPVTEDVLGFIIALVIKSSVAPMPVGELVRVTPGAVVMVSPETGQTLVVNPEVIFGWIPFDTLLADLGNKEFQAHPEDWCKPGFNPEGIAVI